MKTIARFKWLPMVAALGVLAGCGGPAGDLRDWVTSERARTLPRVEPISAPLKFTPQSYDTAALVDPFGVEKLTVALRRELAAPNPLVASELQRRKEPLEAYPLDSMKMVGSVARKGSYALLKVDSLLFQVKVGDYLGQNYGKIMKITETEITLREIVQDSTGEWVERLATLQLQEGAQ